MSGTNDRDRLVWELHDRSRDVGGNPIDLATVRRSAGRIRWRRRGVAGLATAAMLAIAVSAGLAVTDTSIGSVARPVVPIASASNSMEPSRSIGPSPSASPSASNVRPAPDDFVALVADAPMGPTPAIDLLVGSSLHHPDGIVEHLPGRYTSITSFRGGWLASRLVNGTLQMVTINSSGELTDTRPGGGIAISEDGTEVAWSELGGDASAGSRLLRATASGMGEGEAALDLPANTAGHPVGFSGPGEVVYSLDEVKPKVLVTDFAGHEQQIGGLLYAGGTSESEGLVSGTISSAGEGSCSTVISTSSGQRLWQTCDFALRAFSPDGKYVFGTDAYGDGLGSYTVAMLEARTGKIIAEFRLQAPNAFTGDSVWEDGSHLLTPLWKNGSWHLLRLGLDRTVEQTVAPVQASETDQPWHFPARP